MENPYNTYKMKLPDFDSGIFCLCCSLSLTSLDLSNCTPCLAPAVGHNHSRTLRD